MNNPKLASIISKACADLAALANEGEDKIETAMGACAAEAQENEVVARFRLAFSITLDLDMDKMTTDLSFSTRTRLTAEANIPDPDQTVIDFDDEKPRVKSGELTCKPYYQH